MTSILNAEPSGYAPEARLILQSLGQLTERQVSRNELISLIPDVDVLIVRLAHEIDDEILAASRRLRVIATATTGLDHIDVAAAAARGIVVLSLAGEANFLRSIPATAEHTWALLLALHRRVPLAVSRVAGGHWSREGLLGTDLCGQRLGVVGVGRIGQMVARIGAAFGMDVAGFDPYLDAWPPAIERMPTLASLLRRSDVLTLHVPLTPETRAMLGSRELGLLPPGAVLVNTSRGDVVDEAALATALLGGSLRGAALDVLRNERHPADLARSPLIEYLRSHSNLLITPHIGGYSEASLARAEIFVARRLATILASDGSRNTDEGQVA